MKTTRRRFMQGCAAGAATAGLGSLQQLFAQDRPASGKRPNIVVILADDMGYGDVSCYDPQHSKIPTPHIDRLAQQGMRFTDAHTPSALCTPTRYALLTGRYTWRSTLQKGVLRPWQPPLIDADRPTLPGTLRERGYHTACFGKWHLGMEWPGRDAASITDVPIGGGPITRGFDRYFGTDVPNYPPFAFIDQDRLTAAPTDTFDAKVKNFPQADQMVVNGSGPMVPGWRFDQILPTITEKTVEYLGQRAADQQPFMVYFSLTTPHEPLAPSEQFRGKSGISAVGDLIMETDWAVGQVTAALDRLGLADNTLVIFTTDNGHCRYTKVEPFELAGHRVSGPYRGLKGSILEGGHRVPFIARWPGVVQPDTRCDQMINLVDLFATCAAVTNTPLPDAAGDSVDLTPLLRGSSTPVRETMIVHSGGGDFAIRQGPWLLALCPDPELTDNPPPVQLYNLDDDPGQANNLSAEQPERVAAMTAQLEKIVADGRSTAGPLQQNDVPVEIVKKRRKRRP